jgi:hypothetical protein
MTAVVGDAGERTDVVDRAYCQGREGDRRFEEGEGGVFASVVHEARMFLIFAVAAAGRASAVSGRASSC